MGQAQSYLQTAPVDNTYVKTILNTILREMFIQINLVDLYSLADPERCKSYVLVTGSALEKLFVKFRLYPTKKQDGTFYFQRIDAIQRANPLGDKQVEYCQDLAFFFIRVFQIFAAISLTILDTDVSDYPSLAIGPGAQQFRGTLVQTSPLPGFQREQETRSSLGARLRGFFGMSGGAVQLVRIMGSDKMRKAFLDESGYAADSLYRNLFQYLMLIEGQEMSKTPLYFEGFTNFGDSFEKGVMSVTQDSLYKFSDVSPLQPLKRSKLADPSPRITYQYKVNLETGTLSGTLKLADSSSMPGGIALTLEIQDSSDPIIKAKLPKTREANLSLEGLILKDTNTRLEIPQLLARLFREVYVETKGEIKLSTVALLKKYRKISGPINTDRTVLIDGTTISIPNPVNQKGETIIITYKGKYKLDEKQVDVTLRNIKLTITKQPRKLTEEGESYQVSLDFSTIETVPDDLMLRMRVKAPNAKTFVARYEGAEPLTEGGDSIPKFLQKALDDLPTKSDAQDGYARLGIQFTKDDRMPIPYDSDKIPDPFKVKPFWEALRKKPAVKAHCVARALQLLNASAIQRPGKAGTSSVCDTKFPYLQNGSLPPAGEPITKEVGLVLLGHLFFDKLLDQSKLREDPNYRVAAKQLRQFFETYESLEEVPDTESFTAVRAAAASDAVCKGMGDGKINLDNARVIAALHSKTKEMIYRQKRHLTAAMGILFKVFDRKELERNAFGFHPDILVGGMDALNRVAGEARNLLVNYYSDCEGMYREGLKVLDAAAGAVARVPKA